MKKRPRTWETNTEFANDDGEMEMDSKESRSIRANINNRKLYNTVTSSSPDDDDDDEVMIDPKLEALDIANSGSKDQWWKGQAGLDFRTGSTELQVHLTTRKKPEIDPIQAVMHGLEYIYCLTKKEVNGDDDYFESFGTLILQTYNDMAPVTPEPARSRCIEFLKDTALRWRKKIKNLPSKIENETLRER